MVVRTDFQYCGKEPLKQGMEGTLIKIDNTGDALIDFDGVEVRRWVLKRDFSKLQLQMATSLGNDSKVDDTASLQPYPTVPNFGTAQPAAPFVMPAPATAGLRPLPLAALAAVPSSSTRARSAEPFRVHNSPAQEPQTAFAEEPPSYELQLQRAREQQRRDLLLEPSSGCVVRSCSAPHGSSSSKAEPPATGPVQILHVSVVDDGKQTSPEVVRRNPQLESDVGDDPSDPSSPRRRQAPVPKAERSCKGRREAPHVVLSLRIDKQTFLKKKSGGGGACCGGGGASR